MLVAVYGSLRKTLGNHYLLSEAQYLGTTTTTGFTMFSLGGFPYILPSNNETPIVIEVYKVTSEEFDRLDRLEGYPRFYDRKVISTEFGDAWIYFIDEHKDVPEVPHGDWLQYTKETDYPYR
jgi:gamma-glutamylcyclotransferase (GGCT)/AIG2-like uncharacterized protein YtfP